MISSWEKLFKQLRDLPFKSDSLERLSLSDLPKQVPYIVRAAPAVHDELEDPELTGVAYVELVDEGSVEEIMPGMAVAVYSETKEGRPWVGDVVSIDLPKNEFMIHWYEPVLGSKQNKFKAMYVGTKAYTANLSLETVMYWGFSENRDDTSFTISNYHFQSILNEYQKLDK